MNQTDGAYESKLVRKYEKLWIMGLENVDSQWACENKWLLQVVCEILSIWLSLGHPLSMKVTSNSQQMTRNDKWFIHSFTTPSISSLETSQDNNEDIPSQHGAAKCNVQNIMRPSKQEIRLLLEHECIKFSNLDEPKHYHPCGLQTLHPGTNKSSMLRKF